jgi:hypothetical protein
VNDGVKLSKPRLFNFVLRVSTESNNWMNACYRRAGTRTKPTTEVVEPGRHLDVHWPGKFFKAPSVPLLSLSGSSQHAKLAVPAGPAAW